MTKFRQRGDARQNRYVTLSQIHAVLSRSQQEHTAGKILYAQRLKCFHKCFVQCQIESEFRFWYFIYFNLRFFIQHQITKVLNNLYLCLSTNVPPHSKDDHKNTKAGKSHVNITTDGECSHLLSLLISSQKLLRKYSSITHTVVAPTGGWWGGESHVRITSWVSCVQ